MRAFVTGASGFVGQHLVPRLTALGYEVHATDRELDVANAAAIASFVADTRPDTIVHLAAVSSVAAAHADPAASYRVNFLGARSVLEAVAQHAPRARVLLLGSGEAYGSTPPGAPPFTEASPLRPGSPYARTKAAADLLGAGHAERGLDVVRVRPFNHSGPGQSEVFVASSFAKQLAEIACGQRPAVLRVGNLDCVRDFLDVEDVVDAYLRLCDPRVPAAAYNVASGRGTRIGTLLERLCEFAGVSPRIEIDRARVRPTDATVGDATRLREATGWTPRIPLDATLERLLAYWRGRVSAS